MAKEADIFLRRFTVGMMETNCYLVADPVTKDACLIDPGADALGIDNFIRKSEFSLRFIINTHGHGDHIGANNHFKVPIYIHRLDKDLLRDPDKNMSRIFFFTITSPEASKLLEDGDKIKLGRLQLEVIHTPGHTPGSISIRLDGVIFTGDTLFQGGVGRTDFSYGDEAMLFKSIKDKLLIFNDDTVIYPGHGESSTIGDEKRTNPFIN